MAYIEWQDWMTIGIPLVDADHKVLISLINQVQSCLATDDAYSNLGSVLRALDDYTDYHFQREEKLLEEVGYAGLTDHKALHTKLSGQVREIIRRYEASQTSVRAVDILSFLEHWLTEHILNHDMAYRRFALGNEAAEQSAAAIGMGDVRGNAPARSFDWNSLRVLIVDDNPNFLALLETILSGVGIGYVQLAHSATEGLELLATKAVDAVISDWHMAGMNGVDFAVAIRASLDPIISNVAVLMVSGRSDEEVRSKAVAAGVDEFLEKPISARELLLTLARVVTEKRG
jgi:hemerythrin-like metal-binding protein